MAAVAQTQINESTDISVAPGAGLDQDDATHDSPDVLPEDLWSAAYHEAVKCLGDDINSTSLKGETVRQLFAQLEEIDKEASQLSLFLRGLRYLRSLQIPLERFKLALDLAAPLTSLELTTATVFGVVKSVTAVSTARQGLNPPRQESRWHNTVLTRSYLS